MANRKQIKSAKQSACICAIIFMLTACNHSKEKFDAANYLQLKIDGLNLVNNKVTSGD